MLSVCSVCKFVNQNFLCNYRGKKWVVHCLNALHVGQLNYRHISATISTTLRVGVHTAEEIVDAEVSHKNSKESQHHIEVEGARAT